MSPAVACLFLLASPLANAVDLNVRVSNRQGHAVADAVVTIRGGMLPVAAASTPVIRYVDQRNETFIPYVQVFHPGDSAVFRNSDQTRHHAYSFSDVQSFQFLIRAGHQSPPVELDKPGVVAVGCNIHDHMITYLFVSSAPVIAITPHDGSVTLADLPAGTYAVEVWHPQLRPDNPPVSQEVTVDETRGTAHVAFTLSLLPDRRLSVDREHPGY